MNVVASASAFAVASPALAADMFALHPDAVVLALGAEFDAACAAYDQMDREVSTRVDDDLAPLSRRLNDLARRIYSAEISSIEGAAVLRRVAQRQLDSEYDHGSGEIAVTIARVLCRSIARLAGDDDAPPLVAEGSTSQPDAELIALGVELDAATDAEAAVIIESRKHGGATPELERRQNVLQARGSEIAEACLAIRPRGLSGVMVHARLFDWATLGDHKCSPAEPTSMRAAWSVASALIDVAGRRRFAAAPSAMAGDAPAAE